MKFLTQYVLAIMLLFCGINCFAGEDSLYVAPPAGSAFLRVFNLQSTKPVTAVSIGKFKVNRVDPYGCSNFVFLDAATKSIKIGQDDVALNLKAGAFYTLAYDGITTKIVDTEALTDKRKALLHLVNLTGDTLDMKTAKGDIAIIAGVNSYTSGARAINPAKMPFSVYQGETKILETPEIFIDRGNSGSLFVFKSGSTIRQLWLEDKLSTDK